MTITSPIHFVQDSRSRRCRLPIALLCLFFGVFGLHRFYVQKFGTGLLQLLTLGGLGIWVAVDLVLIFSGYFTDDMGFPIRRWR
jgi:TM2 domain-containing membrane protein YozV